MKIYRTDIEGVLILEPEVFGDARGYFFESFSRRRFEEAAGAVDFVQDNESKSCFISSAGRPRRPNWCA